jgi:hypothetical protein
MVSYNDGLTNHGPLPWCGWTLWTSGVALIRVPRFHHEIGGLTGSLFIARV